MAELIEEKITGEGSARIFLRDDGTYMVAGPSWNGEFDTEEGAREAFEKHFGFREEREIDRSLGEEVSRLQPGTLNQDLTKVRVLWKDEDGEPMTYNGIPVFWMTEDCEMDGRNLFWGKNGNYEGLIDVLGSRYGTVIENKWGIDVRVVWVFYAYGNGRRGFWGEGKSSTAKDGRRMYLQSKQVFTHPDLLDLRRKYSPITEEDLITGRGAWGRRGMVDQGWGLGSYWMQPGVADFSRCIEEGVEWPNLPETIAGSVPWQDAFDRSDPENVGVEYSEEVGNMVEEATDAAQRAEAEKKKMSNTNRRLKKKIEEARQINDDLIDVLS